ncbi:MAG TPA: tetratricopeptide repeat protein [Acidiferrobacter sp.]|nr:tetratricopeptide repeat protein [Acidiferrobacter sp.]
MTRRLLPAVLVAMAALLAGCATTIAPLKSPVSRSPAPAPIDRDALLYHVLVGDIAGQQGHLGEAARAFGKAAEESGDLDLMRRSALLSLYARRYGQARQQAHLWVMADPKSTAALEALAAADLGLRKFALAEHEFEQALALGTARDGAAGRAFAFEHIATLLLARRPSQPVLTVMHGLSLRYPKDAVGYYTLASLARQYSHPRQALAAINQALTLKPRWEDAAVLKARILWVQTPLLALHFSQQFLRANPDATRLRLDYARRLVALDYWHQALAQFRMIARAVPNDPQVLYAAGLLALRTNEPLLARRYFKRSLVFAPGDAHTLFYLGEIAEHERRFTRARYYYDRVGFPYRFAAQLRKALIPLKESHPQAAWQALARVTAHTATEDVILALARNQVLVALHRYAQALQVLVPAIAKTKHQSGLLYARALTEEKLGQVVAAEADLEALLSHHPHDPMILNALGYTYINHGQHEKRGLTLVRRALALDPGNPYILDSLGWAYYRLGQPKLAAPYLRKAFARSHNATIAAHLGAVLWALGHHRAALRIWRAASAKAPHNATLKAELTKHPSS